MCIAPHGNPFQSYGVSLAIWDHTVFPTTWHKWMRPALTPARQASTRFTYPGGMEGWVDIGSLIAARPGNGGIEPTTAWLQVRRLNRYATKPPSVAYTVFVWSCLSAPGKISTRYTTPDTTVEIGSTSATCSEISCNVKWNVYLAMKIPDCVSFVSG